MAHPKGSDLLEPLEGPDQARDADAGRGAAKSLQGRLPATLIGDQQGLQASDLSRFEGSCQGVPQPRGRLIADLGDQPGQHGDARQEDLAFDQSGRGQVEQDAGAFGADPGPVGEPAGQGRGLGAQVEVAVAVVAADLGGVVPALLPRGVAPQALGLGDAQLPGDVGHDARWDLGGVGQEGAQESHRAELHGEPQTVVVSSVPIDQAPVGVVEMEVATELGGRRLARIAAVAALLLLSQEVDGHARSPSRNLFLHLGIECQIGSPARGTREPGKNIGFPEPIPGDKMARPYPTSLGLHLRDGSPQPRQD